MIREEFLPKKEIVNWNNVVKLGFDIKNSWTSQKDVLDKFSGLSGEMEHLSNEIFSNLRGNWYFYHYVPSFYFFKFEIINSLFICFLLIFHFKFYRLFQCECYYIC